MEIGVIEEHSQTLEALTQDYHAGNAIEKKNISILIKNVLIKMNSAAGKIENLPSFEFDLAKAISNQIGKSFFYLYLRWKDNKSYEGLDSYEDTIKDKLDGLGVEFIKMMNNPFRVIFSTGKLRFSLTASKKKISLKQIKKQGVLL